MNFKQRYKENYTRTKALAHFFSACTITMCVALVDKNLLLIVAFYPIVLEAWQTFSKYREGRAKIFNMADAVWDFIENFSGIMVGLVFVAIFEKFIM